MIHVVQLPGGTVLSVKVDPTCAPDKHLREQVVNAVLRTETLPYKGFESVFQREITLNFVPAARKDPPPMILVERWPKDGSGQLLQGTTLVFGLLDTEGRLIRACVRQSSGYEALDLFAIEKMTQKRFQPQMARGVPVSAYVNVPVALYEPGVMHADAPGVPHPCTPRPLAQH